MNPLLSLRALATNVKHAISEIADDESGLGDTSGLDTRAQNILIVRHVVRSGNACNVIEVARSYIRIEL